MWGDVYFLIAVILSLSIIFQKYPNDVKDIKFTSIAALIIYLTGQLIQFVELTYIDRVNTMLTIVSLSLVFVILLMLIRKLKPVVFQYPYPIVFLPLMLPVSFAFMMDTIIVEQIIFASIQAVVIVVLFLLTAGYSEYMESKWGMGTGLILFILAFVLYWMVKEIYPVPEWIWKIATSAGMVLVIYSFSGLVFNKIYNRVNDINR